jgi:transposase
MFTDADFAQNDGSKPAEQDTRLLGRASARESLGPSPTGIPSPSPCRADCPRQMELAVLRSEVGYWRKMHQKALEREAASKERVAELEAKLRLRERQLFGRKSEKGSNHPEKDASKPHGEKKPRGQQRGGKGHGRRDYSHLPAKPELHDLPDDQRCCPACHLPFEEFPGTEDSEVIEIEVKAHRRVIQRKRYKKTCRCDATPGIITAPGPPKLIPKGILGISVWTQILLDKFLFLRPSNRLLADLKTHDLDLAPGTLHDGLKMLAPLFAPVYEALAEKNRQEDRWHADETRWLVFVEIEGKVGHKWYMWVFLSQSTVVYILDPSRCATVPKDHFAGVQEGILCVDRYSAYKAMAKTLAIILAFCWAHVRRDFLGVAKDWPQFESWALDWVGAIGELYHLNHLRLEALGQAELFAQRDQALREAIDRMEKTRQAQQKEDQLHGAKQKILQSLETHWEGLTVFVDHPEVPMDNNKAERAERTPVIARNNFYGSFAVWSGVLTAVLFSIFKTLELGKLNPRLWLNAYLEACAANRGKAPDDIRSFLPWNMSQAQRQAFSTAPKPPDTS